MRGRASPKMSTSLHHAPDRNFDKKVGERAASVGSNDGCRRSDQQRRKNCVSIIDFDLA